MVGQNYLKRLKAKTPKSKKKPKKSKPRKKVSFAEPPAQQPQEEVAVTDQNSVRGFKAPKQPAEPKPATFGFRYFYKLTIYAGKSRFSCYYENLNSAKKGPKMLPEFKWLKNDAEFNQTGYMQAIPVRDSKDPHILYEADIIRLKFED